MNLILFTKRNGRPVSIDLGSPRALVALGTAGVLVGALVFMAGAGWAYWHGADGRMQADAWTQEFERQRAEIIAARRAAEDGVNALALRVGRMQAHVLRLDALGNRLTRMADLDEGEFDFDQPPALGGPEVELDPSALTAPDFIRTLDALVQQLDHREQQLTVLENLLLNRNLQAQVSPAGRPIASGWLSSPFGARSDPFTGKRAHHGGIDFSGRRGSEIVAVAAGVVSFSGSRYGYGNLVEINHGNGLSTRYGHNQENLVKVGDTVKKGDPVALMGDTGRATAPHVHFEVLQNGRAVNPSRYTRAD
ncbi:MAG: M23 family metallopeptidase [Gammaproteobacteria bacterium]